MAELKFNGCRLEVQLEAQSPMIHFQYRQPGATIRASEVKPKLDRLILDRLQKETGKSTDELKKSGEYGSIFTDQEHDALNYRMELDASESPYKVVEVGTMREYGIFFGNSGKDDDEKVKGILSNPRLTILCFNKTLRSLIECRLETFFLVTNFGTMQSKGFGSFVPRELYASNPKLTPDEKKKIAAALKEETHSEKCYAMIFGAVPEDMDAKNEYCKKIFDEIKSFYSIMKSGQNFKGYSRSYLYQYMHIGRTGNTQNAGNMSIDNEKAWMKQNGIAPIVAKPENTKKMDVKDENPRYVRSLLGVAGTTTFVNNIGKRETIIISDARSKQKEDRIERMNSPILFKIVKNNVFIAARDVPDEIYDQKFEFANKKTQKKGIIKTPSIHDFKEGRFDIQAFLDSYVRYYNSPQLRQDLYGIKNNVQVKEVK